MFNFKIFFSEKLFLLSCTRNSSIWDRNTSLGSDTPTDCGPKEPEKGC